MRVHRFQLRVAMLVVLCLAVLAGPAAAQDLRGEDGAQSLDAAARQAHALAEQVFSSDDPAAAFDGLSAREQALLRAGVEEVDSDFVVVDTELSVMSPGCWTVSGYTYGTNVWGGTLWRYWLTIDWCISTGNQVYWGAMTNRWGETFYPGWSFQGHIHSGGRLLSSEYRHFTQGRFVLGSGGWDVQEARPCIQLRGYWNATANSYASCAI